MKTNILFLAAAVFLSISVSSSNAFADDFCYSNGYLCIYAGYKSDNSHILNLDESSLIITRKGTITKVNKEYDPIVRKYGIIINDNSEITNIKLGADGYLYAVVLPDSITQAIATGSIIPGLDYPMISHSGLSKEMSNYLSTKFGFYFLKIDPSNLRIIKGFKFPLLEYNRVSDFVVRDSMIYFTMCYRTQFPVHECLHNLYADTTAAGDTLQTVMCSADAFQNYPVGSTNFKGVKKTDTYDAYIAGFNFDTGEFKYGSFLGGEWIERPDNLIFDGNGNLVFSLSCYFTMKYDPTFDDQPDESRHPAWSPHEIKPINDFWALAGGFPTTKNAYLDESDSHSNNFIWKPVSLVCAMSPGLSKLVYSSYLYNGVVGLIEPRPDGGFRTIGSRDYTCWNPGSNPIIKDAGMVKIDFDNSYYVKTEEIMYDKQLTWIGKSAADTNKTEILTGRMDLTGKILALPNESYFILGCENAHSESTINPTLFKNAFQQTKCAGENLTLTILDSTNKPLFQSYLGSDSISGGNVGFDDFPMNAIYDKYNNRIICLAITSSFEFPMAGIPEFDEYHGENLQVIFNFNLAKAIDPESGVTENSVPDFSVYPNPATGIINISGLPVSAGGSEIEIFNALGNKVMTVSNRNQIDVGKLPAGVYTIRAGSVAASFVKY